MPTRRHPVLRTLLALLVLLALAAFALAWKPAIAPVAAPSRASFDPALVRAGARVANLGNCVSCHTVEGGAAYAGGRGLATPFGTVYATNITPDPATGIGNWNEAAFTRAVRKGVARDGHLLYPAFPYDHFTQLQDADLHALYAFMMTRDAVQATTPANQLMFPLQFRPLVAGWNLLFLAPGPRAPVANQSAQWNRGAYLVGALAHCGGCHTPRNALGAEVLDRRLDGGEAEGWHATALDTHSPSPVPWTAESLSAYLRSGLVADHAITAGPMQDVVRSLAQADAADVQAIATFITAGMRPADAAAPAREQAARAKAQAPLAIDASAGAKLYADNCASCHDLGRGLSSSSALRLPLAVALYLPDARNLLHIVRQGIAPPTGHAGRWMPPFEGTLDEQQLAVLARWLREQVAAQPPWSDLDRALQDTRPASP
jgi:mono/diheme cytochrome c family protein